MRTPVYNNGKLVGHITTTNDTVEDIINRRKRAQRDARLVQMWTK